MRSAANLLGEVPGDLASNMSINDVTLGRPEELVVVEGEEGEEEEEEDDTVMESGSISFLSSGTPFPLTLSKPFLERNSELLERFRNKRIFDLLIAGEAAESGCGLCEWET